MIAGGGEALPQQGATQLANPARDWHNFKHKNGMNIYVQFHKASRKLIESID